MLNYSRSRHSSNCGEFMIKQKGYNTRKWICGTQYLGNMSQHNSVSIFSLICIISKCESVVWKIAFWKIVETVTLHATRVLDPTSSPDWSNSKTPSETRINTTEIISNKPPIIIIPHAPLCDQGILKCVYKVRDPLPWEMLTKLVIPCLLNVVKIWNSAEINLSSTFNFYRTFVSP